ATAGNDWHIVSTADFNGDGRADILWRNDDGSLATWVMNGSALESIQFTPAGGSDIVDASGATAGHAVHAFIGSGSDSFIGGAADDQIFTPNSNFAAIEGGGGNDRLVLT